MSGPQCVYVNNKQKIRRPCRTMIIRETVKLELPGSVTDENSPIKTTLKVVLMQITRSPYLKELN